MATFCSCIKLSQTVAETKPVASNVGFLLREHRHRILVPEDDVSELPGAVDTRR